MPSRQINDFLQKGTRKKIHSQWPDLVVEVDGPKEDADEDPQGEGDGGKEVVPHPPNFGAGQADQGQGEIHQLEPQVPATTPRRWTFSATELSKQHYFFI